MSADDKLLTEVQAMQKADPGLSYDQCWNAVENRRKALPCDLGAAARALQASHPGLDFEAAWDLCEAEALPFLKKNLTVGQALVLARKQKPEESTQSFDQWLDGALKRITARPAHVEAIEEPWPAGKLLLIRGIEGTYVD